MENERRRKQRERDGEQFEVIEDKIKEKWEVREFLGIGKRKCKGEEGKQERKGAKEKLEVKKGENESKMISKKKARTSLKKENEKVCEETDTIKCIEKIR